MRSAIRTFLYVIIVMIKVSERGLGMLYTLGNSKVETWGDEYYVAPSAQVIGQVRLGRWSSVWFNCVLRGDSDWLIVGDGTNVQDGTIVHTDAGVRVEIGSNVTVGHRALLHGCTIDSDTLVGNGAVILDGARIGAHCIVAAGTLVPPRKIIPSGSVVMGSPSTVVRQVTEADLAMISHGGEHYRALADRYRHALRIDPRS